MIKVLGLALYGPLAASTRYRLGQYVPGLAEGGIDLEIRHLLGDEYLRSRASGGALPLGAMLQAGLARIGHLLNQRKYNATVIHCELFPLMPGWLERMLIRAPYIYDFDDAFYLKYRSGRLGVARPMLGSKFEKVIAGAAAVTAGNRVLDAFARKYNNQTHHLPTVVDTGRYVPEARKVDGVFTVGWIGSSSTAPYLAELVEPLSAIGAEGPVRLVVVGGKAPAVPNVSVVEIPWQEATELELLNSFDVGVMPLPDDEWTQGKCAFKLIQYLACGVPVVASRVGANVDVVTPDCGYLASGPAEWAQALRLMRDDPVRRAAMGQAGRQRVVQHYSLSRTLPRFASVIRSVVERG